MTTLSFNFGEAIDKKAHYHPDVDAPLALVPLFEKREPAKFFAISLSATCWNLTAYRRITLNFQLLRVGATVPLTESCNQIEFGGFSYWLFFGVKTAAQLKNYLIDRDRALSSMNVDCFPDRHLSGIPFETDDRTMTSTIGKKITTRNSTVYAGIDLNTGAARAVKEIHVRTRKQLVAVTQELQALSELQNCEGIIDVV